MTKLIGLSTSCWNAKFLDIQDCIANIANLSFKHIELGSAHKFDVEQVRNVKEVQKEYNLFFSIHAPFPPTKSQFILNPASLNSQTLKKTD